jgi:hypothetical protein
MFGIVLDLFPVAAVIVLALFRVMVKKMRDSHSRKMPHTPHAHKNKKTLYEKEII